MAKRQKQVVILLVAFLLLLVAIFITKAITKHVDAIATVDEEVIAIEKDTVNEITWTKDSKTLTFIKEDDNWKDKDDAAFPVDEELIEEFLSHFESVHASFIIDDVEDYDQYGLKSPEATLTIKSEDGDTEIKLGGFSTMDSKRYISLSDGTVYLIDDDIDTYLSTDRDDFMKGDHIPDYAQVTEYKVVGDAEVDIVYDEESHCYTDDYIYYSVNNKEYEPLGTDLVTSYMNEILNGEYKDYVTYTVTEDELKEYGLDNPSITISITGVVNTEEDEQKEESVKVFLSQIDDDHAYLQFEGSQIVYNVDYDIYTAVAEGSYESLRPLEIVSLDWEKVDSINASVEDKNYEALLTHEKNDDGETTATINDKEVSIAKLQDAVNALKLSKADSSVEEGDLEFEFTISLENENYKTLEVSLYRYDGSDCLVKVNDKVIGLMDRSLMSDVKEAFTSAVLSAQE